MSSATSQSVYGCIIGQSTVRLWGLTSNERLRRQLRGAGVTNLVDVDAMPAGAAEIVLLHADYLYDQRIIRDLVTTPDVILEIRRDGDSHIPVAAHVRAEQAPGLLRRLRGAPTSESTAGLEVKTPATLSSTYVEQLLKSEPPVVLPTSVTRRRALERHLFDGSYKGVTDFITKWVWPTPARWVTRWCAERGIRPNLITSASVALVVTATLLFASAWYGIGLAVAWVMTFLDTVDGKLARVTVSSTRLGHALDHGLDIIHPPFWYLAWGFGLSTFCTPFPLLTLDTVLAIIGGAYILGRLVEAAFEFWLTKFTVFSWRPIDSYFRLIVARRNPNLVLLSGSFLAGRPDCGLLAVAAWTSLSSVFLVFRLGMALYSRATSGPLHPWLRDVRADAGGRTRAARPFARHALE